MVGAEHVAANKSALETRAQGGRDEEVINTPADIALANAGHRAPPGIVSAAFLEFAEGIEKTRFDERAESSAFFECEAMAASIGSWIGQIELSVCHVKIAAEDHRFFPFQFLEIANELAIP